MLGMVGSPQVFEAKHWGMTGISTGNIAQWQWLE